MSAIAVDVREFFLARLGDAGRSVRLEIRARPDRPRYSISASLTFPEGSVVAESMQTVSFPAHLMELSTASRWSEYDRSFSRFIEAVRDR